MSGRSPHADVFDAAIVGLGRIGQGYDYDAAGGGERTHASAFAAHAGFQLVAGVDPDPAPRARFEAKFRRPTYADVAGLLARHRPHVVAIGVPTAQHAEVFHEVMAGTPRAVLCEKPIAASVQDAKAMVAAAERHGCALAVNYIRRFDPGVAALKRAVDAGEVGAVYKASVWYSKGLLNNGSHFVDLLRLLLGEVTSTELIDRGRDLDGDAEPDFRLRFGDVSVTVLAAREECVPAGEMTLMATAGTIRYAERGARIELVGPDGVARRIPSELARYQWHVAAALHRHLTEAAPLASDGRGAIATLTVIDDVLHLRGRS